MSPPEKNPINHPVRKTLNRGRPLTKTFPDPIPDALEIGALTVLNTPPKKDQVWEYL